jgi:hypothetical protein
VWDENGAPRSKERVNTSKQSKYVLFLLLSPSIDVVNFFNLLFKVALSKENQTILSYYTNFAIILCVARVSCKCKYQHIYLVCGIPKI